MICAPSTGSEKAIPQKKNCQLKITEAHKITRQRRICLCTDTPDYIHNTEKIFSS